MNETCTEKPTRTQAQREQMMRDAESFILGHLRKYGVPASKFDDHAQDCRLAVWTATLKFDESRGTRWTSYAVGIVKKVMCRIATKQGGENSPGNAVSLNDVGDVEDKSSDHEEPDIFDEMKQAIRMQLSESKLAKLKTNMRRIVEMIAFEGLSPAQVADQLGHEVKHVKVNLQAAVRTMLGEEHPLPAILAANSERILELRCQYPNATMKELHEKLGLPNITQQQLLKAVKRIEGGINPEGKTHVAGRNRRREVVALHSLIVENAEHIRTLFPGAQKSIRTRLKTELGLELSMKQIAAMAARIERGEPIAGKVEDFLPPKQSQAK